MLYAVHALVRSVYVNTIVVCLQNCAVVFTMSNTRWVKYRSVKRAVEADMKCMSDKKCRVDDDNDVVTDVACSSSSFCTTNIDEECENSGSEACAVCDDTTNITNAEKPERLAESSSACYDFYETDDDDDTVDFVNNSESCCDQSSPSDNDSEPNETSSIGDDLASWALKHRITRSALSDLLKTLSKHRISLPKDARTLFNTSSVQSVVPMNDMFHNPGEFAYFGIEKQIQNHLVHIVNERHLNTLELFFNVDGVPLFRSSSKQFWPILCAASIDGVINKPFVIAVFCGNSKPASAEVFLREFVTELCQLQQSGVCFGDTNVGICVKGFICDAPARAFVKCIKGHSGYYACEKCVDRGQQVNKKLTFPNLHAELRSDKSFFNQTQEQHHKGVSPLADLNVGLVSRVPLEYMHLVCLGVMRKLLMVHWLRGNHSVRISMQMASLISNEMLDLKTYICSEFQRKPRPLSDIDRWKAVEFRLFLCYIGPVVLRGSLPSGLYDHYMLLHVAVVMLLDPQHAHEWCDDANKLLRKFVSQLYSLYGADSVVYTMHSLIHVTDDVKQFGALDSYSAFAFENELGRLKRLLRSGKMPLRQLCRRLAEQSTNFMRMSKTNTNDSGMWPVLSGIHCDGPTCGVQGVQYNKMHYLEYLFIRNDTADSYALLKCGKIVKIVNFIQGENVLLIGHAFEEKSSFFSYPCDSQLVNIFKLKRLRKTAFAFSYSDILRKCMVLKRKEYHVSFPLLHVQNVSSQ